MAYNIQYQSIFSNKLNQQVTISIAQKDSASGTPIDFLTSTLELTDTSDENTIIARECMFEIWVEQDSPMTWETFLAGSFDEWYITVSVDGRTLFLGYLTPEEGNAPFLDKPYPIKLRATNGLKLLKDVALTDLTGNSFKGKFTGIQYLTAALSKTLVDIPIRIYGSIYNEDMNDRGDSPSADYLSQIKFDHRTFMKDATNFKSCYDVLLDLFGRHSRLFFWDGKWVIFYIPEHQYRPGGLWYTEYTSAGVVISGAQDTEDVAGVGKTELIYPQNMDQFLNSSFPIKFAKTIFNYETWPEIPLNSKFQRGTFVGSGVDSDGNPYEDYTIEDWTSGQYTGTPSENSALPNLINPNPDSWVRRSTYNQYGVEIRREVLIVNTSGVGDRVVQSEGIPVNSGDRIRFNLDWRTTVDLGSSDPVPVQLIAYIKPTTGNKMMLTGPVGGVYKWVPSSSLVGIFTTPNGDLTDYQNISIESPGMPVDGFLYVIILSSVQLGGNSSTFYKGFSMEYTPYIGGGYIPIRGDYWQHTQNANELDKDEGEIQTSDTITRVLQGCMFNADGVTATTQTWYRYGLSETRPRHFKEIVNIGRYNLGYRRFWRIEGSFCGLSYSPLDNPLAQNPISFHKNYRFTDLTEPREFILTTPLSQDIITGVIKANFEEVYKTSADGTQMGDTDEFNYIFSN